MTTQPAALTSALSRQQYRLVPLGSLQRHPQNRRRGDVEAIVESIRVNGFFGACGVQASTQLLVWGNHRADAAVLAAERMADAASGAWEAHNEDEARLIESWRSWPARFGGPLESLPIIDLEVGDDEALNILLADNATSDKASWDRPALAEQLASIQERRGTLEGTGFARADLDALRRDDPLGTGAFVRGDPNKLADRFLVPPFSVLDARQGYWQERKRAWLALGLRSELGRPRNLLKMSETVLATQRPNGSAPQSDSGNDPQFFYKKQQTEERLGHALTTAEFLADHYEGPDAYTEGTSIFDPVLTELAYRWWSPEGARVLDPFAGGSVRGIVASRLGRSYVGIDLSRDQIAANEAQAEEIGRAGDPAPLWFEGDARVCGDVLSGEEFDFILSCPPYFNLERYTDDPADLSTAQDWPTFCGALEESVASACSLLRPGRFACFVVGNVREENEQGRVLDLIGATIEAFSKAGLVLYNDAILVTAVGSLAIRAARIFRTRKLGRTHQQVLTFLKPPLDVALEACGPIEVADPAEAFGEPLRP